MMNGITDPVPDDSETAPAESAEEQVATQEEGDERISRLEQIRARIPPEPQEGMCYIE